MTEIYDKQNLNKYESWIWVELLAFDNAKEDQGVGAYLDRLGFIPYGISLMASASDFIMLHAPLETEKVLFPDICTRFGHAGNEDRSRQDWTNHQLRSLIKNLQRHGIKVFVSVFLAYHRNKFHNEWASAHPEVFIGYEDLGITDGINPLSRLKDSTYYEDIFVSQLTRVMNDYGFDGWHGADSLGPAGPLDISDCSDSFFAQFAEYLGDKLPADIELITKNEVDKLKKRMHYIWYHLNHEWCDFNMMRWESFWRKTVTALRPLGKKTMINSAGLRSAFESIAESGIDYRRIAAIGVDYLTVDTVAANFALIHGCERHFELAATLAEMKAFVPEMKVIFLHGIKDVVESYDLLRHSPARLEREFFTLANQYYYPPDSSLSRCADGFMACLGDGIKPEEWRHLQKLWDDAYSFDPVRTGSLTWVFDDSAIDKLRYDYPANGTWPGFKQVSHLVENYDVQISSICLEGNIGQINRPLIVPNFDLLDESVKQKLLSHNSSPVILFGNFLHLDIPETASAVSCKINDNCKMACVILNGGIGVGVSESIDSKAECKFIFSKPSHSLKNKFVDYLPIPDEFWNKSVAMIQRCLAVWDKNNNSRSCKALKVDDGLRIMEMEDSSGVLRTALISCAPAYITPKYSFSAKPCKVRKISGFPYTPLEIADDSIVSGHNHSPLHVPPYGLIVMDVIFENTQVD